MTEWKELLKEGVPMGLFLTVKDEEGLLFRPVAYFDEVREYRDTNNVLYVRLYGLKTWSIPWRKVKKYCLQGHSIRIGFGDGSLLIECIEGKLIGSIKGTLVEINW
jgi:hypothetical protein